MTIPMKTRSKTPKPSQIIDQSEVRQDDILVGKAHVISRHVGNLAFRALIGSRLPSLKRNENLSNAEKEVFDILFAATPAPRMIGPHPKLSGCLVVMKKKAIRMQICNTFKQMYSRRRKTTLPPHLHLQFPRDVTYSQVLCHVRNMLAPNLAVPSCQIVPVPDGGFPSIQTVPNPLAAQNPATKMEQKRVALLLPTTESQKKIPTKMSQARTKKKRNVSITKSQTSTKTKNKDRDKKVRAPTMENDQASIDRTRKIPITVKQVQTILAGDEDEKKVTMSNSKHWQSPNAQLKTAKVIVFHVSPEPVQAGAYKPVDHILQHDDDFAACDPLHFLEDPDPHQSSLEIPDILCPDYTLLRDKVMSGASPALPPPAPKILNHPGKEPRALRHPNGPQYVSTPDEHASKGPQRDPWLKQLMPSLPGPIPGRAVLTAEETLLLELALENQISGLCHALKQGQYMGNEISRRRQCVVMLRNWLRHYENQGNNNNNRTNLIPECEQCV